MYGSMRFQQDCVNQFTMTQRQWFCCARGMLSSVLYCNSSHVQQRSSFATRAAQRCQLRMLLSLLSMQPCACSHAPIGRTTHRGLCAAGQPRSGEPSQHGPPAAQDAASHPAPLAPPHRAGEQSMIPAGFAALTPPVLVLCAASLCCSLPSVFVRAGTKPTVSRSDETHHDSTDASADRRRIAGLIRPRCPELLCSSTALT